MLSRVSHKKSKSALANKRSSNPTLAAWLDRWRSATPEERDDAYRRRDLFAVYGASFDDGFSTAIANQGSADGAEAAAQLLASEAEAEPGQDVPLGSDAEDDDSEDVPPHAAAPAPDVPVAAAAATTKTKNKAKSQTVDETKTGANFDTDADADADTKHKTEKAKLVRHNNLRRSVQVFWWSQTVKPSDELLWVARGMPIAAYSPMQLGYWGDTMPHAALAGDRIALTVGCNLVELHDNGSQFWAFISVRPRPTANDSWHWIRVDVLTWAYDEANDIRLVAVQPLPDRTRNNKTSFGEGWDGRRTIGLPILDTCPCIFVLHKEYDHAQRRLNKFRRAQEEQEQEQEEEEAARTAARAAARAKDAEDEENEENGNS